MAERDYSVKSAGHCLDVLIALGAPEFFPMDEPMLSEKLDITWNQAFRALKTLESRNLAKKVGKTWVLTPEIIRIAEGFRCYLAQQRAKLARMEEEYLGHIDENQRSTSQS